MKWMLGIAIVAGICMNNAQAMHLLKCCMGRNEHVELYDESDESCREYTYETKLRYEHPGASFVAISPDNTQVLSIAKTSVMIQALTDKKPPVTYECSDSSYAAFSSDGRKALIGKAFQLITGESRGGDLRCLI